MIPAFFKAALNIRMQSGVVSHLSCPLLWINQGLIKFHGQLISLWWWQFPPAPLSSVTDQPLHLNRWYGNRAGIALNDIPNRLFRLISGITELNTQLIARDNDMRHLQNHPHISQINAWENANLHEATLSCNAAGAIHVWFQMNRFPFELEILIV